MAWKTRPTYEFALHAELAPVSLGTLPSGYEVTLPNLTVDQAFAPPPVALSPLLGPRTLGGEIPLGTPARDPRVGSFIRDTWLTAGTLGELGQVGYVPDFIPDSTIGNAFTIGESAVGFRHYTHKAVTPGASPGAAENEVP